MRALRAFTRMIGGLRTLGSDHPVGLAAGIFALLSVVLFAPALWPGRVLSASDYLWTAAPWQADTPPGVRGFGSNGELVDSILVFQPFYQYIRGALPDVPLWNPHVMAGRPFLGNSQSSVFSVFSLPAYVMPFWRSLAWIAILKVFSASFGTFLLARAMGQRLAGSLLAGVVFGFGMYFVIWNPWPLSAVWALIPWLLLATERLVRRPGPLPAAALAVVVALQYFAGHPESSFHAMFFTVVFFAWRLSVLRPGALVRRSAIFGAALAGGALLAAIALVPFLELLFGSADLADRSDGSMQSYVPRQFLFGLFLPDYWGRPTHVGLQGFLVERAIYPGALTLMLVAAALILRPTAERLAVAGFGAFSLAIVFGAPGLFGLLTSLPGFSTAHNTRMTINFLLCAALLGGWGLEELMAHRRPARARVVVAACGGLLLLPLAFMVLAGRIHLDLLGDAIDVALRSGWPDKPLEPQTGDTIRLAALLVWLLPAAASTALVVARLRWRLGAAAFAALAAALLVADLFHAGMGQTPAIAKSDAVQPATGAIRYLQSRRPARFVGVQPSFGVVPLPPNVAMRYGLYDARGYDYPVEKRFQRYWQRAVAPPMVFVPTITLAPADARAVRGLSLLGVTDLLQQPSDPPLRGNGLRLAYEGSDARVYANPAALPRAWVAGAQRVVAGEAKALDAVTAPGFDARQTVVVERALRGIPADARGAGTGVARIERYGRERIVVRAKATRPGVLVLSDVHFPGWHAWLDGREVPVERVDYLLRGVQVGAGEHRVEFRYEPGSWRIGWIVSLVSLLALGGVVGWELWRRRRPGAAG
ncbi:MAG: hypothetical protein ACR2NH_09215 [Solirubrobacteraceae bacterium]